MTKPAFTPGPWTAIIQADDDIPPQVFAAKGHVLCATFREADARLIAAAPDMYAQHAKVAAWLDMLAAQADRMAKDTRFKTLADASAADARNYRAVAAEIRATMAKAVAP